MEKIKTILNERSEAVGIYIDGGNECIAIYDNNTNIYESFRKVIKDRDHLLKSVDVEKVGKSIVVSAEFKSQNDLCTTDEEDLKLNLIPDLKLTNDRGETLKITTHKTIIRIGNSVLLKHAPDITVKLDKIFKESKEVTIDLEYKQIDSNYKPVGNVTKRISVCSYDVREYYDNDMFKTDVIHIFNGVHNRTDELIAEYRYRTKGY